MRDNSTILHRLQTWAMDQPEQAALYHQEADHSWKPITSRAYWLQTVRFALALQESGIQAGDRVMIYALNSPEWIQWELATWLAGAISVGLHPNTPGIDLSRMVDSSKPKLILLESDLFREKIQQETQSDATLLTFLEAVQNMLGALSGDEAQLLARGTALLQKVDSSKPQMVIFTSGTTGHPKGVMLGLRQLTYVADSLSREWNLPFMDGVLFSFLPLAHVAEKIQTIAVAISQRYAVWFNSRYERFLPELKEVRPTFLLAVPRVWERFKEQVESQKPKILQRIMEFEKVGSFAEKLYLSQVREQLGLDRVRIAVSGAVKLAPPIAEWFMSLGIEIQEIYGMSESGGLVTLTHPGRKNFESVGQPAGGVEVKITPGGEIWVKGPNIFFGYWNDPEATAATLLEDGWLKTGDLGEWTPELRIIGRNRDIIKLSSGRMLAPLPIENALKEIPEISNVCIVGEGKSHPLALITLKEQVLMEYKFVPGAIEGLAVEDENLKRKIAKEIETLYDQKKITEKITRFVILSRDFLGDLQELTPTQKLNRNRIQQNFKHFINLQFEG